MSTDDFDLVGLADYLHLDRAQVQKLADRGKLPGRKVAGVWRFSAAEIHHWLEQQIGLSDDDQELARVEVALDRQTTAAESGFSSLVDMLPRAAIELPLAAKTKSSVITGMIDVAARTGWLWDPARMEEAVRQREELHPTALENGVALLHPRRPLPSILERAFIALGRTDRGIPFGGSRGAMTDIFFLICSVNEQAHLQTLARLSRLVNDVDFVFQLRHAPDATAVLELVAASEQALLE